MNEDISNLPEYREATIRTRKMFGELPLPKDRDNPTFPSSMVARWGYVYWREMEDGTLYGVLPMGYGKGRICGDLDHLGYAEFWCFENLLKAIEALRSWNPEKRAEVEGWVRHYPTRRMRIGGDPETEHLHR